MKTICIKQPWASLIATGKKTIETRTWQTKYRGDLLVVASLQLDKHAALVLPRIVHPLPPPAGDKHTYPLGQAVAVVRVVDCRLMKKNDVTAACCDVYGGAWAWILEDIRAIQPFSVKGRLGIFEVSDHPRICYLANSTCR